MAATIGGGTAAILTGMGMTAVLIAAAVTGTGSLLLYGRDIIHLYRSRKRRVVELNSRMAAIALGYLAVTLVLAIAFALLGVFRLHIPALVFLIAFGWLSGLGLAKLYKIVAFLTWLECYGPVLGKTPTPRVQDLVVEPRAARWFWLYYATVACAALALLVHAPLVLRAAAAGMMLATAGIMAELIRTRRLAAVKPPLRFPKGACKPPLLYSQAQR